MSTRTRASGLVAAAVTAALGACSTEPAPEATSGSLPPATSIPASPSKAGSSKPAAAAKPTTASTAERPAGRTGKAPGTAFAVATRQLDLNRGGDRPLTTTVWYPRGNGPFPLIVFSHGLGGTPADYAELTTAWARAGFVVAAPAYPHTSRGVAEFQVLDVVNQPLDAEFVITRTLAAMRGTADPERVAAAGHSAGGITTLGLFTSTRDPRLAAGVVLAGRQILPAAFTGSAAPMLFVHGRKDPTIAYADGRAAYDAVPWPKALLSLPNSGHLPSGRDLVTVAATTTDFWRWSLYGDAAAKKRLRSDAPHGTLTDKLG